MTSAKYRPVCLWITALNLASLVITVLGLFNGALPPSMKLPEPMLRLVLLWASLWPLGGGPLAVLAFVLASRPPRQRAVMAINGIIALLLGAYWVTIFWALANNRL